MKKIKNVFIMLLIILLVYFLLRITVVKEMLQLIFIAFIISYTLKPVKNKLVKYGLNPKISALIIILGGISLIIITFMLLLPSILKEGSNINNTLTQLRYIVDMLYSKIEILNKNKTTYLIISNVYEKSNNALIGIFSKALDSVFKLGENILSLVVIPVVVYYFISENDRILNKLIIFVPVRSRTVLKRIGADIDKVLGRYIMGQFLLSIFIGILTFFILMILKVDYPLLLSILNGIFNIIPYFGPLFGAIPSILMALIKSPETALWTSICLYILQQIEGDIISPKITGDSVSIHPLVVILLLIIGGKIAGFIGMVLAVPIGVIIKILYEDLNYYLF